MRKIVVTFGILISSFVLYGQNNSSKIRKLLTPIPITGKQLDIPVYEDIKETELPFVYWHFAKQKEKQLKLKSPELDKNITFFRLWVTNPVGKKNQPHVLLEILQDSVGWKGNLFLMRVNFNYKTLTETITKSKKVELHPVHSDWSVIMDSLVYFKITELPTDEKIPNYYSEADRYNNNETTFAFEYATNEKYRFFQYSNLYRKIDEFWQPKNVEHILMLLERYLSWDKIAKDYFNEN